MTLAAFLRLIFGRQPERDPSERGYVVRDVIVPCVSINGGSGGADYCLHICDDSTKEVVYKVIGSGGGVSPDPTKPGVLTEGTVDITYL